MENTKKLQIFIENLLMNLYFSQMQIQKANKNILHGVNKNSLLFEFRA